MPSSARIEQNTPGESSKAFELSERRLPLGRGRTLRWPRMRPRFIREVDCNADRVMEALRDAPGSEAPGVEAHLSARHAVLTVPIDDRQFWSTQFGVTVENAEGADGEAAGRVIGIFSPHPEIWTAYIFALGTLMLLAVLSTMFAIVQLSLGELPSGLVATLIVPLVATLFYTSALVGQSLALGEMYALRRHLDECIRTAEERASRDSATAHLGSRDP